MTWSIGQTPDTRPTSFGGCSEVEARAWSPRDDVDQARQHEANDTANKVDAGVSLDDFHAYMPQHSYIFEPSREMWPASSVNSRIAPMPALDADGNPALDKDGKPKRTPASVWLDRNKPVEQMTWAPGKPTLIRDRLIAEGGWIEQCVTKFNLYGPQPSKAAPGPGDITPEPFH